MPCAACSARPRRLAICSTWAPSWRYYHFPDEHTPEPLDNVGYFDLSVSDAARDLRRNTVLTLEKMSVPVEYTFHAAGRSQHGMSLRHAEALSMSDAITTAKLIIKQQAYESGCHASFMPKPLSGEDGSAMFLHQSLFDHDGNNVFWGEDDDKYHLSDIAKHYMAGILAHAREISAITNPTVNSYKRITTGGDSVPQYATWGLRNRASMVRIPVYKPGKQLSTRIELRSPDPMANPYLVNAVTLAAGLDGIERKLGSSRPRPRPRRSSLPTVRWSRPATRRCRARSRGARRI